MPQYPPPREDWDDQIQKGLITRPANYTGFTPIANPSGTALQTAINAGQNIWLSTPGIYTVTNPITINRSTALYIHGISKYGVELRPSDVEAPMFIVEQCPLIQGFGFQIDTLDSATNFPDGYAFDYVHDDQYVSRLELLDVMLMRFPLLRTRSPGNYIFSRVVCDIGGGSPTSVLHAPYCVKLDHDHARFYGSSVSMGASALQEDTVQAYEDMFENCFVYVKRGLCRWRGGFFSNMHGHSGVRIDAASLYGAHEVTSVRAEATTRRWTLSGEDICFVYVPPSASKIDVILKANHMALAGPYVEGDTDRTLFTNYNGNGDCFLLGNNADSLSNRLCSGTVGAAARIIAMGNSTRNGSGGLSEMFDISGGTILECANVYNQFVQEGISNPYKNYISATRMTDIEADLPVIPETDWSPCDPLPPLPQLTAALAGMTNVKNAPYNAAGDGTTDDRAAIQAAIAATLGRGLYFPAGNYRLSGPITVGWDDVDKTSTITTVGTVTAALTRAISSGMVDASGNQINFGSAHGLTDGQAVTIVASSSIGLTVGALYWINEISSTAFSFHTSQADALADTARVDLASGSATITVTVAIMPGMVDATGEQINYGAAHGLIDGRAVMVASTDIGLTANTAYWVNAISATAFSFHTSRANALADSGRVNLATMSGSSVLVSWDCIEVSDVANLSGGWLDRFTIPLDGGGTYEATFQFKSGNVLRMYEAITGTISSGATMTHIKWHGDDPLHGYYQGGATTTLQPGVSFWGAGRDASILVADSGPVVLSSCNYSTIRDMGFQTTDYTGGGDTDAAVGFVWESSFSPIAPFYITWLDCAFRGGRAGLAFGWLRDGSNDFTGAIRCRFNKTRHAIAAGFFNAIANEMLECEVTDCERVCRKYSLVLTVSSIFTNIAQDIVQWGASGVQYFRNCQLVNSNIKPYQDIGASSNNHICMFEDCNLTPTSAKTQVYHSPAGPLFLRCIAPGLKFNLPTTSTLGKSFAVRLYGNMPDFVGTGGANGRFEELD